MEDNSRKIVSWVEVIFLIWMVLGLILKKKAWKAPIYFAILVAFSGWVSPFLISDPLLDQEAIYYDAVEDRVRDDLPGQSLFDFRKRYYYHRLPDEIKFEVVYSDQRCSFRLDFENSQEFRDFLPKKFDLKKPNSDFLVDLKEWYLTHYTENCTMCECITSRGDPQGAKVYVTFE